EGSFTLGPERKYQRAGERERPASYPAAAAAHVGRKVAAHLAALPRPGKESPGLPGQTPRHDPASRHATEAAQTDQTDAPLTRGKASGKTPSFRGQNGTAEAGGGMKCSLVQVRTPTAVLSE